MKSRSTRECDSCLASVAGPQRADRAGHRVTISEWDTLEQAQVGALPPLGLAQSFEDLPASVRQDALYVYEVTTQF
jgi:hypothetical protein